MCKPKVDDWQEELNTVGGAEKMIKSFDSNGIYQRIERRAISTRGYLWKRQCKRAKFRIKTFSEYHCLKHLIIHFLGVYLLVEQWYNSAVDEMKWQCTHVSDTEASVSRNRHRLLLQCTGVTWWWRFTMINCRCRSQENLKTFLKISAVKLWLSK